MEAEAQKLQDALGGSLAVYLGSEWLTKQPTLPHVLVLPGGAEYGPPTLPGTLAAVRLRETYLCRALTFEQAVQLAEFAYATLAPGQSASVQLSSEVWGDYTVRTAALSLTYPATLAREDVERIQIQAFTQLADITPHSTKEVPDDEIETTVRGETQFRD